MNHTPKGMEDRVAALDIVHLAKQAGYQNSGMLQGALPMLRRFAGEVAAALTASAPAAKQERALWQLANDWPDDAPAAPAELPPIILGLLKEALAWIENSSEPAHSLCGEIRKVFGMPPILPSSPPWPKPVLSDENILDIMHDSGLRYADDMPTETDNDIIIDGVRACIRAYGQQCAAPQPTNEDALHGYSEEYAAQKAHAYGQEIMRVWGVLQEAGRPANGNTRLADAVKAAMCAAPAKRALSDAELRAIFLAAGFTIKEGQTDLKPYVYAAARAIEAALTAQDGETKDA